jgi:hypothetical protein
MGIEFDRVLDAFTVPTEFTVVTDWNLASPPAKVPTGSGIYTMSPAQIDSFVAANRLLAAGPAVNIERRLDGTFIVSGAEAATLQKLAAERGVRFALESSAGKTTGGVGRRKVGLWDMYGGSMDAGWARWILEQFEFPFSRVFAPELDAGNLNAKYDTLIFVDGGIPGAGAGAGGGGRGGGAGAGGGAQAAIPYLPEEYRGQVGSVTVDRTIPQLKAFIENGGTVVAIGGSATNLARHLGLAIENHLMENGQPLTQQKYYVPGSVLRAHVDTTHPVAAGLKENTDFFFDNSPVWKLGAQAASQNLRPIAWFDSPTPLRSGWAWGQQYLDKGVIAVEARVGKGRAILFGPEILQRGQPHATFKLLFNSIYSR